MLKKLLIASIFIVPMITIVPIPGTIIWYPAFLAMMALGFILASYQIWKVSKPLALLSVYCLYSYIFVCMQHPRAMLLLIVCYSGIAVACAFAKIEDTKIIYKCLVGMALLQFTLLIFQHFNHDPFFWSNDNHSLSETVGFVGSHNQIGIYYAALAPILFHFCIPLILVSVVAIIFSASSAAAIGASIGILTYIWFIRARYLFFVIVPAILVCFFMMHRFDNVEDVAMRRTQLWKQSIEQLAAGKVNMDMGKGVHQIKTFNPWAGAGIGNFMSYSPQSQGDKLFGTGWIYDKTPRWEHAHNDFVEYIFDFGWLGLPILAWLLFDILFKFFMSVKTNMLVVAFSSLVSQGVSSLGVYVVHAPVSYFMICLTLGLFYAEYKKSKLCQLKY